MLSCKKVVSLFMALALLANQGLPLYAGQTKKSGSKKQTSSSKKYKSTSVKDKSPSKKSGNSTANIHSNVAARVEQEQQKAPDYWVRFPPSLL